MPRTNRLLAAILDSLGRYNEAEPLYWHALSVFEHTLGAEHYEIAIHLNNMAANCYGRRDFPVQPRRFINVRLRSNTRSWARTTRVTKLPLSNLAMVRRAAKGNPREALREIRSSSSPGAQPISSGAPIATGEDVVGFWVRSS